MNNHILKIIEKTAFDKTDIITLLSASAPGDIDKIKRRAHEILLQECGSAVHCRGLVEFSNQCVNDCLYCGIRKSNSKVERYFLSKKEILSAARFCVEAGYGSIVLQSGERKDEQFIAFVEEIVSAIKRETVSNRLPQGLGITLCVGEQTEETFKRFF
jgi:biotin synthase